MHLFRIIQSGCTKASLLSRSSTLVTGSRSATGLKTYAPLASFHKTPIQVYGDQYLHQQKDLKRPLSPHLGIYQPQLTWYVSGLHRITGCVMGGAVAVVAVTLMVAPFDFPQVIEYVRQLGLPSVLLYALKFSIAWPLTFHSLNGLRFLGFDMAKGIDLKSVYKGGWFVVYASLIIAAVLTFWRKSDADVSANKKS